MSRAQVNTAYKKQPELFSDFLGNLDLHPLSSDIARVTNSESIKQSIKNLILTNYGERFFNPNLGSNVYKMLFQPLDGFAMQDIKNYVRETITFHERRANLLDVTVSGSPSDENKLIVTITFNIINTTNVDTLNLILQRVR
jgi:phage baseplate assembly protein W